MQVKYAISLAVPELAYLAPADISETDKLRAELYKVRATCLQIVVMHRDASMPKVLSTWTMVVTADCREWCCITVPLTCSRAA